MATEVKVPDIGDFSDVPVVTVLVRAGDTIAKEDPLVELESDKATMEVPSSHAGRVQEVRVSEGDIVSEGSLLLLVEEEASGDGGGDDAAPRGEAAESGESDKPADGKGEPDAGDRDEERSPADRAAPATHAGAAPAVRDQGFGRVHASPSVRAFARNLDIDLARVNGTGRKGRILREDVTAHLKQSVPAGGAAAGGMGIPPVPEVDFSKFGPVEDVEMTRIQKLSGPALHRSWLNVPHVTHQEDADITELDKYRKELDAEAKERGERVTLLAFMVKASVAALRQHWQLNASLHPDGDKLVRKHYHHIGFAADTPQGLMVPVVKDADRKGILEISTELGTLSAAARDGKLKSQDMQGASFTISSLGGIGGTGFTPLVNAPEVAILGLTRARMAPVWNGREFAPRNLLPMSLSYDHRVIDGALAARFCATLKHLLGDMRRLML